MSMVEKRRVWVPPHVDERGPVKGYWRKDERRKKLRESALPMARPPALQPSEHRTSFGNFTTAHRLDPVSPLDRAYYTNLGLDDSGLRSAVKSSVVATLGDEIAADPEMGSWLDEFLDRRIPSHQAGWSASSFVAEDWLNTVKLPEFPIGESGAPVMSTEDINRVMAQADLISLRTQLRSNWLHDLQFGVQTDREKFVRLQHLVREGEPGAWQAMVENLTEEQLVAEGYPGDRATLSRAFADQLIHGWTQHASDTDPTALALQDVIADEFALDPTSMWTGIEPMAAVTMAGVQGIRDRTAKIHAGCDPFLRAFVRATYEHTQEFLKAKGFPEEVVLYRGVHYAEQPGWDTFDRDPNLYGPESDPHTEFEAVVNGANPASSWSESLQAADYFTCSMDTEAWGYVLTAKVPREAIFSMSLTGLGCLPEKEFLTLGLDQAQVHVEYRS